MTPLLTTADLVAAATVNRATRRLLLAPSLWRHKVFTSFPSFSSPSSLPSWNEAVQLVTTSGFSPAGRGTVMPPDWWLSFSSLPLFPNLRHVRAHDNVFTSYGDRQPSPSPSVTSLASLRHLSRLSLEMGGKLRVGDLRLLSTLPMLASFEAMWMHWESGNEETLAEWEAVKASSQKKQRTKRKVQEEEDKGEEEEVKAEDEEEEEGEDEDLFDGGSEEDADDPSLPQRYSPVLLFLHSLSLKPSFVHLTLQACDITPFICDRMSNWPHLLSLSLPHNAKLTNYPFSHAARCFPSLTSLTSPNCSNQALLHFVQLPKLEELCFPEYSTTEEGGGRVRTSMKGFRALGRAASLRSIQYFPPKAVTRRRPT